MATTGPTPIQSGLNAAAPFYDLMHAETVAARADVIVEHLDLPRRGVVDLGAGTGLASIRFAEAWPVDVTAVEPSHAMRAILLTNLRHAGFLDGVTVHPDTIKSLPGESTADVVTMMWATPLIAKGDIRLEVEHIARLLTPAGALVTETQRARKDHSFTEHDGVTIRVGPHTVHYRSTIDMAPDGSGTADFCYEWRDVDGTLLWDGCDRYVNGPLVATLSDALDEFGFREADQFDDPYGTTFSVYRRC